MNITLFKLLATPFFITAATLTGRRWGPVVNGLFVGLPLTTGPISFILASQYGQQFATRAAIGNLAGQVSMCVFCLSYALLARRRHWLASAVGGVAAFLTTTFVLNRVTWQLVPAFAVLIVAIVLVSRIIPQHAVPRRDAAPPRWDLPARAGLAMVFVILLTTFAKALGPQLSGLLSTFPIFGVIFAAFTHAQQGPRAASNLLRGIVMGSVSYAFFFLVIALCLIPLGIPATYALAVAVVFGVSGLSYLATRQRDTQRMVEAR